MKTCPVGVKFLHGDGRTDMTKLMVTFHNSVKAPKNDELCTGKNKKECDVLSKNVLN
jgi:hypothetical protein